jgi:hypothetical protein
MKLVGPSSTPPPTHYSHGRGPWVGGLLQYVVQLFSKYDDTFKIIIEFKIIIIEF